ncbi:MAG: MoaD/ThiS family protein [Gemmatimonadaceae bacterium]
MAVSVVLPGYLQPLAHGRHVVQLDPAPPTVRHALRALRALYPGVYDRVVTEEEELRPHVSLFVGEESVRWNGGLAARIPDGGELFIIPAVSGG